ncbi:MAG: excinuclease ATPase subunit [Proteobacteria bacterium]|nr:excinuclease ATPase subunit [Pseudomonadota bacterium]
MKMIVGLVTAACFLSASDAMARDTRHMFSIAEALRTLAAEQRIDQNVQLIFGNQPHPPVAKNLGTFTSNRKTNAFNKSDKEACEWAFLSAILSLQERARREGGDAVVNIRSYYKKISISHQTKYMCGAGAIVAGVAFRGDVVKLKK